MSDVFVSLRKVHIFQFIADFMNTVISPSDISDSGGTCRKASAYIGEKVMKKYVYKQEKEDQDGCL